MSKSVALDQTNVFVTIRMITDADGTPALSVSASAAGHTLWYRRDGSAVVTDGGAADNMTALTSAHADWAFMHVNSGYYTVAYPDLAFANGVGGVLCGMDATGVSCVGEVVEIDPLFKFKGTASSVTATTTTFIAGPVVKQGDLIYVAEGTGIGQTRLITSATGQIATHLAWDTNISATTSTILLVPGDETLGDGGINCDVATSTRSSHNESDVETKLETVVAAGVNTTEVAGTTVQGTGSSVDLWRG